MLLTWLFNKPRHPPFNKKQGFVTVRYVCLGQLVEKRVSQLNLSVDPTIGQWLIELLYIIVSVSCWRSSRKPALNSASASSEQRVWQALAVLFFALCVSRHLDLETALTEAGRRLAFLEGWYDLHRPMQLAIIGLLAISFIVAEVLLLVWSRNAPLSTSTTLAMMGATFVVTYLMIRSISFHSVDHIIGKQVILGLRLNWILQLGGIAIVLMASEVNGATNRPPEQ